MTRTITHLYDTYAEASRAVRLLEEAGIAHGDISIVGTDAAHTPAGVDTATTGATGTYDRAAAGDLAAPADPVRADTHASGAGAGAGASLGTVLGGGAGLLAGIGALAIPGVGPVVAAGWLVATLTGAGAGAAAGSLLGALVGSGTSEADAHVYAEGVRRGGTLVSVRVDDADAERVQALLDGTERVDLTRRGTEYRQAGWSRFDPARDPAVGNPPSPAGVGASAGDGSIAQADIDRARASTHG